MRTGSLTRAAAVVAVLAATAAGSWVVVEQRTGLGAPVATDEVALLRNDFGPDAIVVPAGTTVTWRFDGVTTHDIVGEGWGTSARTSGTFRHTFAAPGRYDYRCTLHGPMRARVEVR